MIESWTDLERDADEDEEEVGCGEWRQEDVSDGLVATLLKSGDDDESVSDHAQQERQSVHEEQVRYFRKLDRKIQLVVRKFRRCVLDAIVVHRQVRSVVYVHIFRYIKIHRFKSSSFFSKPLKIQAYVGTQLNFISL